MVKCWMVVVQSTFWKNTKKYSPILQHLTVSLSNCHHGWDTIGRIHERISVWVQGRRGKKFSSLNAIYLSAESLFHALMTRIPGRGCFPILKVFYFSGAKEKFPLNCFCHFPPGALTLLMGVSAALLSENGKLNSRSCPLSWFCGKRLSWAAQKVTWFIATGMKINLRSFSCTGKYGENGSRTRRKNNLW